MACISSLRKTSRVAALLVAGALAHGQARADQVSEIAAQVPESIPAPAVAPAPVSVKVLNLQDCIDLAFAHQPALAAARASLAAAESAERGLNSIVFGRLLAPDLPIRKLQACEGVAAASASLQQIEWETRYAVRRTFYSVQYARMQKVVLDGAIDKLNTGYADGEKVLKVGDPDLKVTKIDLKVIAVNREFIRTRHEEAKVGIDKAIAGLREAIGIGPDYPLLVAEEPLPTMVVEMNKKQLISLALATRWELVQANHLNRITELEIEAQRRIRCAPQARTFASGADIHAKPIPQGVSNGEYRPGAIGPEMPPFFSGHRSIRIERAENLNDRAIAVVDKTQNLIALEVEATLLKWLEAAQNIHNLSKTPEMAKEVSDDVSKRFRDGRVNGEEYLRARTLADQAQGMYNEAVFNHALALAALERVTAGGFQIAATVPVVPAPVAAPQK